MESRVALVGQHRVDVGVEVGDQRVSVVVVVDGVSITMLIQPLVGRAGGGNPTRDGVVGDASDHHGHQRDEKDDRALHGALSSC